MTGRPTFLHYLALNQHPLSAFLFYFCLYFVFHFSFLFREVIVNVFTKGNKIENSSFDLQKFGPGVGTLPQLEPPVVQVVVSNAKNQHQQSDNILPQIANKGGQNNYQTHPVNHAYIYMYNTNSLFCMVESYDLSDERKKIGASVFLKSI